MTTKQHPTTDTLLAYIEDTDNADFADVCLHLAGCRACREQIQQLNTLQKSIQQFGPLQNSFIEPSSQLADALDQHIIEGYIDGDLDASHHESVQRLLDTDPGALKAALHYASHSAATRHLIDKSAQPEAAMAATSVHATVEHNAHGFIDQLKTLFDFRPPLWISVSATAAAVFVMTLAVMPHWKSASSLGYTVAAYQDKAVIHYQGGEQLPGIGFFNKAHRSSETFGPLEIRYNDHQVLSLHWPQVPNATQYHLALYVISEGQKIGVHETDVAENQATITDFKAETGKRYEWTINGETSDAKAFYTTGGFVINARP